MRAVSLILMSTLGLGPALLRAEPPRIVPRPTDYGVTAPSNPDWPELIARQDPGSRGEAWAQVDFDHGQWKSMTLPAHWENAGLPDYDGVVWFRRMVEIGAPMAGAEATLGLGAIDDMDVTWVNGKRVGGFEHPGAHFTPRNYKLPAGTLRTGRNVIAVRVMDHGHGGGLAQTHGKMQITGTGNPVSLAGPWRYHPGASLAQLLTPPTQPGDPANNEHERPFDGRFVLQPDDVIALAGGTNLVKQFEAGYLETLLTLSARNPVYFRDLAWQADTVYRQQRPRNFGTHLDLLNRMGATAILACFGQMEALEGATRLPQFIEAYGKLLDEYERRTPRIILVSPHRFAQPENDLLPDLSRHNGNLAAYGEGIRQLAKRRGFHYVDLLQLDPAGLTAPSSHLNPDGQRAWAHMVSEQLTGTTTSDQTAGFARLRALVQRKNRFWRQHWRPTNWSFLYGNRQHVPSSRDHRPGKPRWFPEEINSIIPLIEECEARIWQSREALR